MTGIQLIAKERQEQIEKHGHTVEMDVLQNKDDQLIEAAFILLIENDQEKTGFAPLDWDKEIWSKMVSKPQKERLIIAGALLAAEIDRLNAIGK